MLLAISSGLVDPVLDPGFARNAVVYPICVVVLFLLRLNSVFELLVMCSVFSMLVVTNQFSEEIRRDSFSPRQVMFHIAPINIFS